MRTFLLGKGVEIPKIEDPKYKDLIKEEKVKFDSFKVGIIACKTCLNMRQEKDWDYSPIATMKDMLEIVEWADKVLSIQWLKIWNSLYPKLVVVRRWNRFLGRKPNIYKNILILEYPYM